ncbi:MAG TPA: ubiquitin-like domain-containing protein [Candidatus Saccharimonadales bacterium]|nr:ubiquitin-like domain-containing protein [Candidatus Saccharimonadales bacterium]
MKKLTNKQRIEQIQTKHLLLFGGVVMLVCIMVWYGLLRAATPSQPQRLVTFYDRGQERSIVTTADTVHDALKAADITIDPHDIIEPTVTTKLVTSHAEIIIYRSRPVMVVDGAIRQTIMTPLQSPNGILKAAGLKALGRKDKTTFTQGDSIADSAQTKLTVSRLELVDQSSHISFQPKPNALTPSRGAQVYVDSDGVAHRETYYDLPMNVVITSCGEGSTYTIRSDGAKVDQDGYVLVAANLAAYPRCTVVDTSLGAGKVYDTGGFAVRHPYGFDLATDWTNYDKR